MKGQKWVMVKGFQGLPTKENLKLVDYEVPEDLQDGEILLKAVYLSVDPYMRFLAAKEEEDMNGEQLSEVIMSKNAKFPVGTLVLSNAGWKSHYLSRGDNLRPIRFELGSTPKSYTLGVLGMPGATAYLAFEKCMPKAGETILISAAAGAVGTVVGQLAKIKGLKVVGLVGSDDKLKFCKEELGFDHVFNYKSVKFDEAIKQVAPEGIDIYFDNVGGDYYHTIINNHMKKRGRILVCGSIQTYNDIDAKLFPGTNVSILLNELSVLGFLIFAHDDEMPHAYQELNKLIQAGKLKVRETVYDGIDKMFDAFSGLFKGENIGKAVVKA